MKREQVEALKATSNKLYRLVGDANYTQDGRGTLYKVGIIVPTTDLLENLENIKDAARELDFMIQQIETKKPAGAK